MKYFMQHRNEVAGPLELGQVGRMALLRTNTNVKELRYMLAMVDLLSTCAEVGYIFPCVVKNCVFLEVISTTQQSATTPTNIVKDHFMNAVLCVLLLSHFFNRIYACVYYAR